MSKARENNLVQKLLKLVPGAAEHFRKLVVQKNQKKSKEDALEYCAALYRIINALSAENCKISAARFFQTLK